jgi:chemotaxis signal transduction protein
VNADVVQEERLLTFEVGDVAYALPIADVVEIAELGAIACIPTLPRELGGVMNHHGEALPVMARSVLFDVSESDLGPPEHLLVMAARPGDSTGSLGVPVDRIEGLVSGPGDAPRDPSGVECRPIGGRMVSVVCVGRLIERASQAIRRAGEGSDARGGGNG